jgi:hypothetical protein
MFAKGIPHNFSRFRVFSLFILFAWCRSTARTLMQSRSPISFFDFPLASRRYSLKSFFQAIACDFAACVSFLFQRQELMLIFKGIFLRIRKENAKNLLTFTFSTGFSPLQDPTLG